MGEFFEAVCKHLDIECPSGHSMSKLVANYITSDLAGLMKEKMFLLII